MLSLTKIIALLLAAAIIVLLIAGISAPQEIQLEYSLVVNNPDIIVWRKLTDVANWPEWRGEVRGVDAGRAQPLQMNAAIICFSDQAGHSRFEERITSLVEGKKLELSRNLKPGQAVLQDYRTEFLLRPLRDGSTELNVICHYRSKTLFGKLFNLLRYGEQQHAQLRSDLNRLKDEVERY